MSLRYMVYYSLSRAQTYPGPRGSAQQSLWHMAMFNEDTRRMLWKWVLERVSGWSQASLCYRLCTWIVLSNLHFGTNGKVVNIVHSAIIIVECHLLTAFTFRAVRKLSCLTARQLKASSRMASPKIRNRSKKGTRNTQAMLRVPI